MKILVTSSTGLTGKAAVKALAEKHIHVGAMFQAEIQKDETFSLGASETVISYIESEVYMRKASAFIGRKPNDFLTFMRTQLI